LLFGWEGPVEISLSAEPEKMKATNFSVAFTRAVLARLR